MFFSGISQGAAGIQTKAKEKKLAVSPLNNKGMVNIQSKKLSQEHQQTGVKGLKKRRTERQELEGSWGKVKYKSRSVRKP